MAPLRLFLPSLLGIAAASPASVSIVTSGTPGSTPISLTVQQDVSMSVTLASTPGNYILFALRNVSASPASQTSIQQVNLASNLNFSINGAGSYQMLGWVDEGYSSGDITAKDGYFYWQSTVGLNLGDTVTLRAGSISTSGNGPADFFLPSSGGYELFLINASTGLGGALMSGPATPVPEPSTYGLILGGLALAGAAVRRRRR